MRVSAYRKVEDPAHNAASGLRFGIPDGINGIPTGILNQSCEVNTHQGGVILSNNSGSLQSSPKRALNKK